MNTKHAALKSLLVTTVVAISLPAGAAMDPEFMRDLARTDGNPHGDYAIPVVPERALSKFEQARHDAFIAELSRTDGAVDVAVHDTASDTTVARR